MNSIVMPRIGVNDDFVTIGQWCVKNGDFVKTKQMIAVLETTKETKELFSRYDGYINLKYNEGEEVEVGKTIAEITESAEAVTIESDTKTSINDLQNVTEKAKKLIKQYNIDIKLLPKDKLVKESDVQKLIDSNNDKSDIQVEESLSNHLYILGTGGFTREIISIINQTHAYVIDGIIGGIGDLSDKDKVLGIPIICNTSNMTDICNPKIKKIVNAVAVTPNAYSRKDIYKNLSEKGFEFPNIIHKSAIIGTDVKFGEGNIVFAGAIIGSEAIIGNDCVINANATISHECKIGSHSHIASGAVLAGNVTVGSNTLIGQNVSVYNDVHIGNNVVILNGVSVFKDIPDGSVVKS